MNGLLQVLKAALAPLIQWGLRKLEERRAKKKAKEAVKQKQELESERVKAEAELAKRRVAGASKSELDELRAAYTSGKSRDKPED